jgi:hypothetical protein
MAADPEKRETLFFLDKKTVAKAQLQTAILLWFNEGDPASILALAVNANDCYNALGGHIKGKPSVFQTWLAGQSKTYQIRARRAQNFIKHGPMKLTGECPVFAPNGRDSYSRLNRMSRKRRRPYHQANAAL